MSDSNKNTNLLLTIIVGVVCSILASILYDKFIPFLSWVSASISNTVNKFHSGFIDVQYKHASFGNSDRMQVFISLLIMSVIAYLLLDKANKNYYKRVSSYYGVSYILVLISKLTVALNVFFVYFVVFGSFIVLSGNQITLDARKTFDYNMALKSPFMSNERILDFNRRWSLISSKKDYDDIIKNLSEVKSDSLGKN